MVRRASPQPTTAADAGAPADDVVMSIRMPRALENKIASGARETGLKKQDVARLGLERGVDILIAQLKSKPPVPETVGA